jgi:hypothetical protein
MTKPFPALSLVLAVLSGPRSLGAQEEPARASSDAFGVEAGLTSLQLKDKVLNPLRHSGTFVWLGFFHERPRAASASRLDFQALFNPVASRYESEKNSFAANLRLAFRHAREVTTVGPDLHLLLGGTAEFFSQVAYFGDWDDSHAYWLTAYSLGPSGIVDYRRWEGQSLTLQVSLPVLALVSRPAAPILHKVDNNEFGSIVAKLHENLSFTSVHEHLSLDATARYTRHSARLGRSLFWRISYLHNSMRHSEAVDALRHTVGVSVVF